MTLKAEALLDVYSLAEILEMNDLTEADALDFLLEQRFLILPEIQPLEFE